MYNNKAIIWKVSVIPPIPDYMIPMDFCKKTPSLILQLNIWHRSLIFFKEKMDALYITESMRTYWLHTLYECWDEGDIPYSGDFYCGLRGCFNITINWLYVKLLKVLILCGSQNNTYWHPNMKLCVHWCPL